MKLIAPGLFVFAAVSCEPLPVYVPNGPQPPPYRRDAYENPQLENPYADRDYGDSRSPQPQYDPSAPQAPSRDSYPVAERTDSPDRVISPFAPYNVIDVEGFRTGQLAKDPSNGKIFRIP